MKRKNRRKRTTFLRLFLPGMILPVLLTALLGAYMVVLIRFRCYEDVSSHMQQIIGEYERRLNNTDLKKKIPESMILSLYSDVAYSEGHTILDPEILVEPEIDSIAFTFDRDGNILNSSSAKMTIAVEMSEEPSDSCWFIFDPQEFDIPVMNELIADALADSPYDEAAHEYDITSLYLNAETHKMVPHIINVTKYKVKKTLFGLPFIVESDRQKTDSYQVVVDVPELPEGYVLTELHSRYDTDGSYPRGSIQDVFGCDPEFAAQIAAEYKDEIVDLLSQNVNSSNIGDFRWEEDTEVQIDKLYVNTGEAGIFAYTRTNLASLHSWRRLIFVLGMLFGAMTLFVLTLCIIRHTKNKAQYAFEDYQRALTNNLAHDLKTPLAVIGGYTENVLQMRQECGDETELEYLRSIMKNVAYTDAIIRKTLKLSETEQVSKPRKTELDAAKLVHDLTEKYSAALAERGITLQVSGSAVITADEDLFTAAAENLISNAVKYTPDGGSIRITLSPKQLAVVNDTAENVDTKHLTMPFVKGDKARSDKRSSGLGLAIAAAAAERSGFPLNLDCRDKQFTAVLRFCKAAK